VTILVITTGDHGRTVPLPTIPPGEVRFAHQYIPEDQDPEGHEIQAWNFITYAHALGGFNGRHVLLSPELPDDEAEAQHIRVLMSDWASIVSTATGVQVEIRDSVLG
jgi:hypothetical protein